MTTMLWIADAMSALGGALLQCPTSGGGHPLAEVCMWLAENNLGSNSGSRLMSGWEDRALECLMPSQTDIYDILKVIELIIISLDSVTLFRLNSAEHRIEDALNLRIDSHSSLSQVVIISVLISDKTYAFRLLSK